MLPEPENWLASWNSFIIWLCCVEDEQSFESLDTQSNNIQLEKDISKEGGFQSKSIISLNCNQFANDSNDFSFGVMPYEDLSHMQGKRGSKLGMELIHSSSEETGVNQLSQLPQKERLQPLQL